MILCQESKSTKIVFHQFNISSKKAISLAWYSNTMISRSTAPLFCSHCKSVFQTKNSLEIHVHSIHETNSKRVITCSKCSKQFLSPKNYKRHETIHSEERPFLCEICQKGFKSDLSLRSHREIHIKQDDVSCEICGKDFQMRKYVSLQL